MTDLPVTLSVHLEHTEEEFYTESIETKSSEFLTQ